MIWSTEASTFLARTCLVLCCPPLSDFIPHNCLRHFAFILPDRNVSMVRGIMLQSVIDLALHPQGDCPTTVF